MSTSTHWSLLASISGVVGVDELSGQQHGARGAFGDLPSTGTMTQPGAARSSALRIA